MSGFARIAKGLQTLFPSSGVVIPSPSELIEQVNLVHEFPGRVWQWERVERVVAATNPASLSGLVTLVSAAIEEWVEVLYASVAHDSVTARNLEFGITVPQSIGATFLGKITGFATGAGITAGTPSANEPLFGNPSQTGAGTDRVLLSQPLYIPPLSAIIIQSNPAAAAVFTITGVLLVIRHPFPERPLF